MSATLELRGIQVVVNNLLGIAKRLPNEVGAAMFEEAQIERGESQRRTPVDTGALRASHVVERPKFSGRDISVRIAVGGPAAPYAVIVHEDLDAFHSVGESKFLEKTLFESAPHLHRRIAKRIDLSRLKS